MAVLTTGNTFASGDQVTAGSLNNAVNDAEFAAGAVDGISTQKSGSGAIIVKDLGISRGKIAIDAVGTDQLANDVVISTSGSITGAAGSFTTLSASGDISVDGSVKQSGNTGNLTLKGGDTDGANIELYGSNHATESIRNNAYYDAGVHVFRPVDGSSSSVVITSDGEVGIGEVSPTKLLHVKSPNSDTAETIAVFGNGDIADGLEIKTNGNGGSSLDWGFNAKNTRNLVFDTNQTERMRIDSSGNVGIGTTSPANSLHIVGDDQETSSINTALATSLEVAGNGLSASSGGTILFSAHSGLWKFAAIKSLLASGSDNSVGHLAFCTRPDSTDSTLTEAMRIQYDGRVGIGTTGPEAELHVQGPAGAGGEIYLTDGDDTGGSNSLLLQQSGGISYVRNRKSTGPLYLGAGDGNHLNILSGGNVGIGDTSPSYKLDVNGTGRFVGQLTLDDEVLHNISGTQARQPGYYAGTYGLEIEQTAQGSTIHIGRSNGNCMNVGADATAAGTDVNVVYFRDTGAGSPIANEVGKIIIDTTSTNYETSSDYRLKENEVDITDGIDRLKELKPYRFNFTRNPSKVVDGFFAHEVSPVVPESISGEKDQVDDEGNPVYQGIDQSKLVPLLTAALQEAVAKIEALEARVQTLEG